MRLKLHGILSLILQLTKFRLHPIAAGSREPDGPCIDTRVCLVNVDEVREAVALLELVHEAAAALKTTKEDNESAVRAELVSVYCI